MVLILVSVPISMCTFVIVLVDRHTYIDVVNKHVLLILALISDCLHVLQMYTLLYLLQCLVKVTNAAPENSIERGSSFQKNSGTREG